MTRPMLSLFVSGNSPTSLRARSNLANLQANGLPSHWDVEVVDVLKNPGRAEQAGILATPTLSVPHPSRPRRIVGDLGDAAKVLEFLGIGMGSEGT